MQTVKFDRWVLEADRSETQAIYADTRASGATECGCADCRRFETVRAELYPRSVLEVLNRLGVDPKKEVEVMNFGPDGEGHDIWSWWLLFIGRIKSGPDAALGRESRDLAPVTNTFRIGFTEDISIPWAGFRDRPYRVQVECYYYAPEGGRES